MNGKSAKAIRKLQRLYNYSPRQYNGMKDIYSRLPCNIKEKFNYELEQTPDKKH